MSSTFNYSGSNSTFNISGGYNVSGWSSSAYYGVSMAIYICKICGKDAKAMSDDMDYKFGMCTSCSVMVMQGTKGIWGAIDRPKVSQNMLNVAEMLNELNHDHCEDCRWHARACSCAKKAALDKLKA